MTSSFKARTATDVVKVGFDVVTIILPIDQIVRLKVVSPSIHLSSKYQQIVASIREVGVIEPPVVANDGTEEKRYILLDGHLRLHALQEIGETEVMCLVSNDDEAFTYNKHVSRLSPIQEHYMIRRAVERGVSEERIARALNLDVQSIVRKRNLLEGICPEAAELLKDKIAAASVFLVLRRMKAYRQIEVATLMNDAGLYSGAYANALLAATPATQLHNPERPKKIRGLSEEQITRMENEMAKVQGEYQLIEESYGSDVLSLTLAKGYLGTLLGNANVVKYLARNHSEILTQFQKITDMTSLAVESKVADE